MSLTDHFTASITVDQTPDEVFAAITDVRGWWNENLIGDSAALDEQFVFFDEGIRFSRFRLTEVEPGKRIVWQVVDSYLAFVSDHDEWTGTTVVFDIAATTDGTTLHFTHQGLTSTSECYVACSKGWSFYINKSLPQLLATGTGQPIPKDEG